jgi:CheY-like chemotaxis protein
MMKRVLVIDDDNYSLAVARDMLEELGVEVVTSTSSLEANRHIYGKEKPDLILLDVVMPFLGGEKKAALLKERESSSTIPVMLVSSKPEKELEAIARSSGADGYITKPLTKANLLPVIRALGP